MIGIFKELQDGLAILRDESKTLVPTSVIIVRLAQKFGVRRMSGGLIFLRRELNARERKSIGEFMAGVLKSVECNEK